VRSRALMAMGAAENGSAAVEIVVVSMTATPFLFRAPHAIAARRRCRASRLSGLSHGRQTNYSPRLVDSRTCSRGTAGTRYNERMRHASIATILATAIALAGCSSGGSKAGCCSDSPPMSSGPSTTASAGGAADAATTAAVGTAYTTFFNSKSSAAASEAALQHGSAFRAVLEKESTSKYAQRTSVSVMSVRLVSADVADVAYTLRTNGITLPSTGKAVRENGTWKVAAQTFCGLLALEGQKPKQCTDPNVAGLP
jgi:hypothetical protein